ncbi:uncharacterized protein LOC142985076 isoform X15 [Anticarsia gemmatalis]|uniref:uncharacterized protein LOC142985076 isoform X15 n=1 Tax=Anticarsia gemmatalis TaxID=129554 RepID=UPI003F7737FF
MDTKSSEWRPGPTVCRCCLTEGCYKDISTEYFWMGKREVYSEMLSDTFNVTIAYSQSGGPNSNSRLICEPCISRLRDACDFRRQVLECEKTFMQHLDPCSSRINDLEVPVVPLETDVKLERIKLETSDDDEFDDRDFDDDDDDMDDQPLTKLASKIPKKETVDILDLLDNNKAAEKRKSATKTKTAPAKKAKIVKKEPVKATASKVVPKTEKKKKDLANPPPLAIARRNAEALINHATVYPFRLPDAIVMCVYCCEEFHEPAVFRKHMRDEHASFKAKNAFAHCNNEGFLKIDTTEIQCKTCNDIFDKIDVCARHLNEKHDIEINFQAQLGVHPYKFVNEKIVCGICDHNFPCLRQLSRHMASHFQNYTCDFCGKSYTTNSSLQQHLKFGHITEGRICRKCRKTFKTPEEKREHVNNSSKCWLYACGMCNLRFLNWYLKEEHLIKVHGKSKKTYPCSECEQSFNSRGQYRTHFNTTHADIKFVCAICGQKFGSKRYLDQHSLVHTGIRAHECSVCFKAFPRKANLSQHMWIHSEIKRFECKPCNKKFNQRVSYKSHMKVHHPHVTD